MRSKHFPLWITVVFLISLTQSLIAQDGLRGALLPRAFTRSPVSFPFGQQLAAADFDNDQKPDGALLFEAGPKNGQRSFRIELHVTSGFDSELTFFSAETALSISALDVNQDGTPDLVVEQTFTHKRLQVWLNDGRGTFRKARIEDFPSMNESPTRLSVGRPEIECIALYLPSKLGPETAPGRRTQSPRSEDAPSALIGTESQFARAGYRGAGSSRAPPSLLPL